MEQRKLTSWVIRRKLLWTETSCFPKKRPPVVPGSTTWAATARMYWSPWNFPSGYRKLHFSQVPGFQGLPFDWEQRAWLTEITADNLPAHLSPSQLSFLPVSYGDLEVMLVQNQHHTFSWTDKLHLRQREGRRRPFSRYRTFFKDRYKNPWWHNEVAQTRVLQSRSAYPRIPLMPSQDTTIRSLPYSGILSCQGAIKNKEDPSSILKQQIK